MKKAITTTKHIQAQYYSHMDFDHEEVGWTSVDILDDHRTVTGAKKAIAAHRKKYPGAKDRRFRIVTTVTTTSIHYLE